MATPKIIVISGTFMNVGKSTLTKGIARNLIRRGKSVVAIKPVETECETTAEDGASYAAITGQTKPKHALIRLHPHGVPPLAAMMEGVNIDWDGLVSQIKEHAAGHDIAFVESMGGLCTPITWKQDYLDLAAALGAPVLLIGRDGYQGAAAMLMALKAMRGSGVKLIGTAFSVVDTDPTTGQNAIVFKRCTGLERVVTIRNVARKTKDGASEVKEDAVEAVSKLDAVDLIVDWILE